VQTETFHLFMRSNISWIVPLFRLTSCLSQLSSSCRAHLRALSRVKSSSCSACKNLSCAFLSWGDTTYASSVNEGQELQYSQAFVVWFPHVLQGFGFIHVLKLSRQREKRNLSQSTLYGTQSQSQRTVTPFSCNNSQQLILRSACDLAEDPAEVRHKAKDPPCARPIHAIPRGGNISNSVCL